MSLYSSIRSLSTALFCRTRLAAEIEEELRSHIECRAEDLEGSGLAREEALRRARLEFGSCERFQEESHEALCGHFISALFQDTRFALRLLRKSPTFMITSAVLLGFGIGTATAVFSLMDNILFKPLPYPDADRIVLPWNIPAPGVKIGYDRLPWDPIRFRAMQEETSTYRFLAAFESASFNLTTGGDPVLLEGQRVSWQFFSVLGVSPALGRVFTPREDEPGSEREVVLSDGLWQERFHADAGILGRVIDLNGAPYVVVGVMPRGFAFPSANEMPPGFNFPHATELWVPAGMPLVIPKFTPSELAVIGRLEPGISLEQAQTAMDLFAARMDRTYPTGKGFFRSRVTPLDRQVLGDTRRPLLLLFAAVGLVLVIVCFNLASLLLTRSIGRHREFNLRIALGAAPSRIMRQLFTETLLLSIGGGMVGTAVGYGGIWFVRNFGPANLPRLSEARLDLRTLGFLSLLTLATSILMGLAPALASMRSDLAKALKSGGQRSGSSPSCPRLRNGLVVLQIAFALVLVTACGLLIRTFRQLEAVDAGFRSDHVLTFEVSLPSARYPDKQHILRFYQGVLEHLRERPEIRSAGITEAVPMGGAPESTVVRIVGLATTSRTDLPIVNYTVVSHDFFSALQIPIERGRDFLDSDILQAQAVTVINRSMAHRFWPEGEAIGKQVIVPSQIQPMTVVGIVSDTKHSSLDEDPVPEMFVPYTQDVWPNLSLMHVVIRTHGDPASVIGGVRKVIHSLDPGLAMANVTTLSDLSDDSLLQKKFSMWVMTFFGAFAVLLAAVGVYGVLSYSVNERKQEIGVRMALGARRNHILGEITSLTARLVVLGLVIGAVGALAAAHLLTGYLYGVKTYDPETFGMVSVIIMFAAVAGGLVPAFRAASIDPMSALRMDS